MHSRDSPKRVSTEKSATIPSLPAVISGVGAFSLRTFGFYWGVLGVVAIIASAIYRISPRIIELGQFSLHAGHWLVLLLWTVYMIHAEGYRGFHCNFAPRVVLRAQALQGDSARPLAILLAPLYCMGFIYATPRRTLISVLVTSAIIALVIGVSLLPQPWRGIIDTGVVAGLGVGIISIGYYLQAALKGVSITRVPADLPDSWQVRADIA